jgi:hypothetical protein
VALIPENNRKQRTKVRCFFALFESGACAHKKYQKGKESPVAMADKYGYNVFIVGLCRLWHKIRNFLAELFISMID